MNPVYTEPVDGNGGALFNPFLQTVLDGTRFTLANGLPVSMVAETYAQLLAMSEPARNVVVASPEGPVLAVRCRSTNVFQVD